MADKEKSPYVILVVEDDPLLSDLVSRKFTAESIPIEYAPTGELALEMLNKETKPSAVLLDIRLPGIDGFEVLRQIRENPETKTLPVIIFSNFGEDEDVQKAKELGATKFVVKVSMSLDEVIELVKQTVDEQ